MKILVTGSNGLVGNAIHKLLTNSDHEHINTSWSLGGIASHVIDITDNESIEKVVEEFRPDAIINSAAMANVDNCEVERDKCWKVNVEGVKNLVNTCDNYGIHLVHISTDYIFDGKKVDKFILSRQFSIKSAYSSMLFALVGVEPPCPGRSIDRTLLKILGSSEIRSATL